MVLCMGALESSTGSVSGFKRLGRQGHSLVSSDRLVETKTFCGFSVVSNQYWDGGLICVFII